MRATCWLRVVTTRTFRVVQRLGYGTMQLTGPGVWGPPTDPAGAVAVLRRAAELGVELFDTADSYRPYVAEDLLRIGAGLRLAGEAPVGPLRDVARHVEQSQLVGEEPPAGMRPEPRIGDVPLVFPQELGHAAEVAARDAAGAAGISIAADRRRLSMSASAPRGRSKGAERMGVRACSGGACVKRTAASP